MSLPKTYYDKPIADDGLVFENDDIAKYIDAVDDVFFYGYTLHKGGPVIRFCRFREDAIIGQAHETSVMR